MKRVNLTNLLVRIENFFCVYRSYSYIGRNQQYLVILRIIIETFVVLFTCVYYFYTYEGFATGLTHNTYICFSATNSLVIFYSSCYNSKHFKEFIYNIKAVNKLYKNSTTYQNIIKMQSRRFYIDMTLFTAFFTGVVADYVIASIKIYGNYFILFELTLVLILELRFYCGNLVFYELIKVIIAPLELMNASVDVVVERIQTGCGEECNDELWGIQRRELEKWGAVSQHLVTASDRLCDSFGVQTVFSFFSGAVFMIILLYEGVSNVVNQRPSPGLDLVTIVYSLISYNVIKLLILSSGQRVIRNGEQLHKNLVLLHNLLVGIPGEEACACARAAAGLARRLRAAPLRLRLVSALTLQMALLAETLAAVANYTIVLLQFNHVV